jgi:hypothetical protein
MQFDLQSIGLTQEELQSRVVAAITDQILTARFSDEDGNEQERQSKFKEELKKQAKDAIDAKVREIGEKYVIPQISEMVESISLEETNRWGEKTGKGSMTFIEYLTKKAEEYVQEPVNHDGKSKSADNYNWSPKSTRIVYLINNHLQFSIQTAMKNALDTANKSIVGGLEAAVKMALQDAQSKLQVTTKIA